MRNKYLLIVLICISNSLQSAVLRSVEKFTIANGLSNSEITSIHLDKKGFLWIGTTDGLNCYDGYAFRNFLANPVDSNSIYSDNIIKVTEDSSGNIWCASNTGVSCYNNLNDDFTYFPANDDPSIRSDLSALNDMVIDKFRNRVYLLGNDFLNAMDIKTNKVQHILTRDFLTQNNCPVFSSLEVLTPSDLILIGASNEVFIYNPPDNSLHSLVKSLKTSFVKDGGILGIVRSDHSDFLIYTKHNLWHVNSKDEILNSLNINNRLHDNKILISGISRRSADNYQIILSSGIISYNIRQDRILSYSDIDFQSNEKLKVNAFLEDNSGLYWFGTNDGLFKVNPFQNAFTSLDLDNITDMIENDFITSACFDPEGLIWIGLSSGRICQLNPLENIQKKMILQESKLKSKINDIYPDVLGTIFISTDMGLVMFSNKQDVKNQKPHAVLADQKIFFTSPLNDDSLWVAGEKGIYSFSKKTETVKRFQELSEKTEGMPVVDFKSNPDYLWIAQAHRIIEFDRRKNSIYSIFFPAANFNGVPFINTISPIREKELLIGTNDGLYIYYTDVKIMNAYAPADIKINNDIHAINKDYLGKIWISTNRGIFSHNPADFQTLQFDASDGLTFFNYTNRVTSNSSDGRILFGSRKGITLFNPDSVLFDKNIPKIQYTQVTLSGKNDFILKNLSENDTLVIDPKYSYIKVGFSSLDFWAPSKNRYKYSLEEMGSKEQWSVAGNQNYIIIPGLKAGNYKLNVMGSNSEDVWNTKSLDLIIQIKAPFMQSHWVTLFFVSVTLLIFYFTFLYATKQLRKLNREYRERELIAKKVEQQKEELTTKNKNITDSINYAKRIQEALMPSQKIFKKLFPESFILHIPKDIVSGDFYWINEVDGRIYFAAVDCTGHGVPGAFMSIIGFELFRRITETEKKKQPAEILKSLSRGFETFFRDVESYTLRDGMDVAFCAFDKDMMHLEFAGAFNPLYLVRDNSITEIKGDRFSVGLLNYEEANNNKFKSYVIPLYEGDIIYIFTDGFADQFGGPEGKKYKYRRFRHLLLALHQLPMEQQIEFLRRSVNDWKGNLDQVDDILIMGIRVTQNQMLTSH
jgi:ligand-binding sensor domain-containing protein/serine phosphatase RsbU (regulator of sigma subunit)